MIRPIFISFMSVCHFKKSVFSTEASFVKLFFIIVPWSFVFCFYGGLIQQHLLCKFLWYYCLSVFTGKKFIFSTKYVIDIVYLLHVQILVNATTLLNRIICLKNDNWLNIKWNIIWVEKTHYSMIVWFKIRDEFTWYKTFLCISR